MLIIPIARRLKAATIACLGAFITGSPVVLASELPSGAAAGDMDISPFYRWHSEMPETPGTLLRTERLDPAAPVPATAKAMRILYSSTDKRWNSGVIPVSATLLLPDSAPPAKGWPLVAWAHGTLGIADVCAPSWTGFRDRDAAYINRWLEQGYAVVATDYQGLGGPGPHPYSFWQSEGASVLDSVRAALAMKPGAISNEVVLAGQSQGGGAALGAAIIAGDYAPELNILSAVVTAPNSTFPDGPITLAPRRSNTMFLAFATGGLRENGPQIEEILSPTGLELLSVARQGCTRDIAVRAKELEVGSFRDLLAIRAEELETMRIPTTDMPQSKIGFPIFLATGQADHTIEPERQYAVAMALCAAGNQVDWRVYDGLGHDGVMHGSLADAQVFVRDRRNGIEASSNCANLRPPGPPGERNANALFNDD